MVEGLVIICGAFMDTLLFCVQFTVQCAIIRVGLVTVSISVGFVTVSSSVGLVTVSKNHTLKECNFLERDVIAFSYIVSVL